MEGDQANFYLFKVKPVPKPRMTKRDKWAKRPVVLKFFAYRDEVILQMNKMKFVMPDSGANILFMVPMPKSWSKKKRALMLHQPHKQKPDVDNLLKAFLDSVCREDDSYIFSVRITKIWASEGQIVIDIDQDLYNDNMDYDRG